MQRANCPSGEELRAFSLGDLSAERFETIASHVTHCAECEASLNACEREPDELLSQLTYLQSGNDLAATETPPEVISAAGRIARQTLAAHSMELLVDPGRTIAHRLVNGPYHLGRFEMLAELGVGSFGYVFRARDTELDRLVAVKIQRAGRMADAEDIERFHREARSAAQLKHPAIVSLYETGQTDEGICFLVTEYIDGETLQSRLARGRHDVRTAVEQIAQIADALQYAHDHGVIHRDVKPSNILIDSEGRPHIMDFGLAKRETGQDATMTPDGQVMGTPAYMSPEQAQGESRHVDARSDVYSLGVVLYEMLTGECPFQGNRRMLLLQVLEDEPRPPRQLNDRIPRDLEIICLKAMAKSPTRRYGTARELADDLRRYLHNEPIRARPIGPLERLARWCRRNPLAASLLVAVTLGSAAGLWHLSRLSTYFVEATALDSARMEAQMMDAMNAFYSEIVDRVDTKKVEITDQYRTREHAIPLPATFTIDAGEKISKTESGMQVRLYSRYPWRKEGGPQDEWERRALDWLERRPDEPFKEFTEIEGRRSLVFATARKMEKSCLNCHNKTDRSPKKDWKEGDVVGVLKIVRPLDREVARTREGLRDTFLLMGGVSTLLVAVSIGVLLTAKRRL